MTPEPLEIGETLLIAWDEHGEPTGEWIEARVRSIRICHNYSKTGELDPYICVGLDHPQLFVINYSLYCFRGHVKRKNP